MKKLTKVILLIVGTNKNILRGYNNMSRGRKQNNRRNELREEFELNIGGELNKTEADYEYDNAMMILADIGVPFLPDGTPLGIGWD